MKNLDYGLQCRDLWFTLQITFEELKLSEFQGYVKTVQQVDKKDLELQPWTRKIVDAYLESTDKKHRLQLLTLIAGHYRDGQFEHHYFQKVTQ